MSLLIGGDIPFDSSSEPSANPLFAVIEAICC